MKLESDSDSIKTVVGSLCSIVLLMVTIFYAYLKFDVLMEKKDVNVLSTVKDLYFDDTDQFHYSNGLNIAVAFTAYDSVQEPILDPTFGELVLNHFSWGNDAEGKPFTVREPLQQHACSRNELNVSEDPEDPKFFQPHKSIRGFVDFYWQKFRCMDSSDLTIYGDFNSG